MKTKTRAAIFAVSRSMAQAFLLVFVIAIAVVPSAVAQGGEKNKRVLVLFSYDSNLPPNVLLEQSLRSTFKNGSPVTVEIYSEYLDAIRTRVDDYEKELVGLLRRKYEGRKFDLIIAVSAEALRVVSKNQPELFPDTPVVFSVLDQRDITGLNLGANVTGVWTAADFKPNLDLALMLQPDTRKVVVLAGVSEFDKYWTAKVREDFLAYEGKLEIDYLIGLTVSEQQQALASLPPHTVVVFTSSTRDHAGNSPINVDIIRQISPVSNAPIYGTTDAQLGAGIVGGSLVSYEASGVRTAQLGLRVLAGEKPQAIPAHAVPNVDMFDWRELRRWGVNESKLPPGSIVRFKQPTLWEQYKWHIFGAISLFVVETLLIIWLLYLRAKRRNAEQESVRFARLVEAEHLRLDEIVSNTPGVVWESRLEPGATTRKIEFVNDYVEQMLGYSVEECLATPNFWLSIIHEDDRERSAQGVEAILADGREGIQQFRCVTKTGRVRWVEAHLAAIRDEAGKAIGLRGVAMDISDRKEAEEALRDSEARFRHMADAAPVLIWMSNTNMHVSYVNQKCLDFTGRSTEALLGEGWLDLVHEDDAQQCVDIYTDAYERREPFVYEYRIRHAEGEFHWLYSASAPRFASDGEFLGYIGSCVDITDRKAAEEAVRESEARFRHMADTAPVLIWIADADMLCTYFNQLCMDFSGQSMEQLLGNGWLELVHEADLQRCTDILTLARERMEPYKMEYRIRAADGEFHWLYDVGVPRFSSEGELLGYIGSCVDITERKAAEEALQLAHAEVNKLKNQLEAENIYLQEEIKLAHNFEEIVGRSDAIKYVFFKIEQVAQTDSTVLILGETGTGKELVARAIHSQSRRKDRPLVKVNCAALSASLIESELFGHERGAFTGAAVRKIGRFELADGATIFLDEIGELPLELQGKLLRVIQEGEFERLGSSKTLKADVRIIAATNRNLQTEVREGRFREDLWYRLNVFPVTVPPLKQRAEDIPLLVEHYVKALSKKLGREITSVSPATMKTLREHSWPGNVRELANVVERAVINARGTVLSVADSFEASPAAEPRANGKSLEEVERDYIVSTLDETGWRIEGPNGAAKILGLNPSTLRTRMIKLGIQKQSKSLVET